jgi:hypothetical protein
MMMIKRASTLLALALATALGGARRAAATDHTAADLPIGGGFEEADAVADATYCDTKWTCTHALQPMGSSRRAVKYSGTSAGKSFGTFYADTLGADGTAGLHNCAAGAHIGVISAATVTSVQNIPEGSKAYQLNARGIDGAACVARHLHPRT